MQLTCVKVWWTHPELRLSTGAAILSVVSTTIRQLWVHLGLYTAWTCWLTCTGHQRLDSVTESAAVNPPTFRSCHCVLLLKLASTWQLSLAPPEPRPSPVGDWTDMLGTSHPLEAAHKALTGRGGGRGERGTWHLTRLSWMPDGSASAILASRVGAHVMMPCAEQPSLPAPALPKPPSQAHCLSLLSPLRISFWDSSHQGTLILI